ncbi:hypothetical protein ACF1BU_11995 [Streptomyces sp. NPDC014724]|uniref:hypothetical protein n=1 Tax=unclassified Streptomyces TaxID=2593676 RepID=UPI0036F58978
MYVAYDGGVPQLVKAYRSDVNTVERLELDVPAGAKSARLSFRCTGTNSAFWAVDQVALGRPNPPSQLAVASLEADTRLLGRPGSDAAWKVTTNGVVRTAQGKPVKGAKVTAELTAGSQVRRLTGTTEKDGSVRFKTTVDRGVAEAALTVTEVRYKNLAYYGELDPVRTLDLTRPTGHRD